MFTADEVRAKLRQACALAGNQYAWAMGHNVKPPYVSAVLRGKVEPGAQILRALGLRRRVVYERIEEAAE
jgi:hypothetical protein